MEDYFMSKNNKNKNINDSQTADSLKIHIMKSMINIINSQDSSADSIINDIMDIVDENDPDKIYLLKEIISIVNGTSSLYSVDRQTKLGRALSTLREAGEVTKETQPSEKIQKMYKKVIEQNEKNLRPGELDKMQNQEIALTAQQVLATPTGYGTIKVDINSKPVYTSDKKVKDGFNIVTEHSLSDIEADYIIPHLMKPLMKVISSQPRYQTLKSNKKVKDQFSQADLPVDTSDIETTLDLNSKIIQIMDSIDDLATVSDWVRYMQNKLNYSANIIDSRTTKITNPSVASIKKLEKDMRCAGYVETSNKAIQNCNNAYTKVKKSSDRIYNQALKIVYFQERRYKNNDIADFLGLDIRKLNNFLQNHREVLQSVRQEYNRYNGINSLIDAVLRNYQDDKIPQQFLEVYHICKNEYNMLKRRVILDYIETNQGKLLGVMLADVGQAIQRYKYYIKNKQFITNDNLIKRYNAMLKSQDEILINLLISNNKYDEVSQKFDHVYELYPENIWNNDKVSPDDVFADRTYSMAEKITRHKVMQIVFLRGLGWNIPDIMKRVGVNKEFITDNVIRQKVNVDWMKALIKELGGYKRIYRILDPNDKATLTKEQSKLIDYQLILEVAEELRPEYINSIKA